MTNTEPANNLPSLFVEMKMNRAHFLFALTIHISICLQRRRKQGK